jgi:hypothetical protein
MTEPKPPTKRLVSPREYVGRKAGRAASFLGGGLMALIGTAGTIVCGLVFLVSLIFTFTMHFFALIGVVFAVIFGVFFIMMGIIGKQIIEEADDTNGIELLTARKAEALPAAETLVRASQEPTEGQEKVLLRAALTSDDTPPEQLLRAGKMF